MKRRGFRNHYPHMRRSSGGDVQNPNPQPNPTLEKRQKACDNPLQPSTYPPFPHRPHTPIRHSYP